MTASSSHDRIVCLGGTFDPVHHGHLIVARSIAEARGFSRVLLVPTAQPPHKQPAHASIDDRLAMLRLATEDDELFEICELEIHREGPSYTIDTVEQLQRHYGQGVRIAWIVGADMLAELPGWHRAEELIDKAELIVASRDPWQRELPQVFRKLATLFGPDKAQRLRESLAGTPGIDISSTSIRDRVRDGKSIRYLTPEGVRHYVETRNLYVSGRP